ncbi:hypothetical protein BH09SUM1_BH09SUM1_32680 [soil metagenome]
MRLPGHHLATWLTARGDKVAYLSAPVSPWHFLSGARRKEARRRWGLEGPRGEWRSEKLFTYIPRTLVPIHRQWPFDGDMSWRWSEAATMPRASGVLRAAGFDQPDFLLIQNWQLPALADVIRPRSLVVSIEDDLAEFPEMPRVIVRRHTEVLRRAKLVTATAESLRAETEKLGVRQTMLMPNGVDTARFRRPENLPARPADMPEGRVAVYIGALDSWFAEDLLAEVAATLSDWKFVLIGPPRAAMKKLRAMPNVIFIGPRAQEAAPPYLWHATAGIIPFSRTPLIESVAPLKLFEYLAAGLPVVATKWREIERLSPPAKLVASSAEFVAALRQSESTPTAQRRYFAEWAAGYDWDRIFSRFYDKVKSL